MIRKLRNILNSKEHNINQHQSAGIYDLQSNNSNKIINQNNQTKSNNGSPVGYLKKKIRSTKSWVKLPKNSKLFQEECPYEAVASLEPANHEFESYTRVLRVQANQASVKFENQKSPVIKPSNILKHSTLNTNKIQPKQENNSIDMNSKIIEKLGKSSIDLPANIPILCVQSFNLNDPKWIQLSSRFSLYGLNVRLIELQKGVPVNALFYLSNLDLIYVKTADDLEGYVPRDCCRSISGSNESNLTNTTNINKKSFVHFNYGFKPVQVKLNNSDTINTNSNNYNSDEKSNDSIKYHSLSIESEYDDLIETNQECQLNLKKLNEKISNNNNNNNNNQTSDCFTYDTTQHSFLEHNAQHIHTTDYSVYKYRDSGYRSEIENNMTNFSGNIRLDDYEDTSNRQESPNNKSPKSNINKCLMNMQSRSRLPISIRSNLNLTLMDDQSKNAVNPNLQLNPNMYYNITYKSPFANSNNNNLRMSARHNKKSEFQRNNVRRSLDSYLTHGNESNSRLQSFYAVSIELDENKGAKNCKPNETNNQNQKDYFPDLDLNRIELDSLNDAQQINKKAIKRHSQNLDKIWTIILKHDARNFQEISVTPGMLVLVIKEFSDMLYVKLLGYENTNLNLSQQYGIIPRNCAVDLQEIIYNSNKSLNNLALINGRKSQITAL